MSLKKNFAAIILTSTLLLLVGCNDETLADAKSDESSIESHETAEKDFLYENEAFGIRISQSMEWRLESEKESDNLTVVLNHNKLSAIVSSVSSTNTFEDIKKELLKGADKVSIIAEEDGYLSYKSKLKEPVRTDVYFEEHNDSKNYIIVFMSPSSEYEANQPEIESLLSNINLN
ncbi:MAG: hypothetical protein R6U02_04160 [Alkalibacterium sp.]|uniref:hypothetical protein n=1 Tax=Alkalibacterium sp. TaxID=1872447 RepID=UPI00397079BB